MRVLVVGGTGFIGPHLIANLSLSGHELTVFHRGLHEADLPSQVRHVHSPSASVPVVEFPQELRRWSPEVVVHMFPIGERDAQALVHAFKRIARRVVAISSGDVYRAHGLILGTESGALEPMPLTEVAPLRQALYSHRSLAQGPDDWMYYYDKILVERAVMSDPDLPGTILRLPAVYGPRDPYHRLLPYLKRMDDHRPAILLDEDQARWRWTHGYVENVAAAIARAVTDDGAAGRIYNVGEEPTPTMAERVAKIGEGAAWQGDVVVVPKERLPNHLKMSANLEQDLVMDTTCLRAELGYCEPVSLEESLERTIAWQRANPPEKMEAAQFDYAAEDAALHDWMQSRGVGHPE